MPRRKRKHIPIIEIAASFAADRLPQAVRDELRARKAPAKEVLRMFTPDHNVLHAWGGQDRWWNLTMTPRGPALKAKDAADTSRAAKALRVSDAHTAFRRRLLKPGRRRKPKGSIAQHVDPWGKKYRARQETRA